jgi:hypothetical protein
MEFVLTARKAIGWIKSVIFGDANFLFGDTVKSVWITEVLL